MSNVNASVVSGNLTRDPELKQLPSGTSVCDLGIAVNRSYKDKEGEYQEEVSFFDITVWSGFGELCARKLRKGDSVTVQGRLVQERWETPEGDKRSKVKIVADQIDSDGFFRSKDEDNQATPVAASQPTTAPATTNAADDDIPF